MPPVWFIAIMLAMPIAFGALLLLMALDRGCRNSSDYLPERYPRKGL